ncbi:MAG: FMN-binding protein, partial [Treponema sp.]|nr:FMN-binding protein [Treponema sp.]
MKIALMKQVAIPLMLALGLIVLGACGQPAYRDGTYAGKSGPDDTGAWGEVSVTIAGGKVASCRFLTYQKDGAVKD